MAALGLAVAALVVTGAVFLLRQRTSDLPAVVRGSEKTSLAGDDAFVPEDCSPALVRVAGGKGRQRTATCGKVMVPYSENSKKSLKLAVTRLIPENKSTRPPVLVLAGGPGDAFTPSLESRLTYLLPLAADRDLLVVDQRGTGHSEPLLDCESKLRKKEDLERCYAGFQKDLEVEAFNTEESARDLQRVLKILDIPRVAIVSVSYGTRLALTFAEAYPDAVELLVLDSPMPRTQELLQGVAPAAIGGLERVLDVCRQRAQCHDAFPYGLAEVEALVIELNQKSAGQGDAFISALIQLSISPGVIPWIPHLIDRAKEGDFELFDRLRAGFSSYQFAFGMHLSVQCAEQYPAFMQGTEALSPDADNHTPALKKALGASSYQEYCSAWKVPSRRTQGMGESAVTVPTLVLSGEFDPITPLSYAQRVAGAIERARLVKIPGVSHGAAFTGCGVLVVQQFLDAYGESIPLELPRCVQASDLVSFTIHEPQPARVAEVLHQIKYRL